MCARNMNCVLGNKIFIIVVILLVRVGLVRSKSLKHDNGHLTDRLINDLYQKYKEAVSNNADLVILRRMFDRNRLFEIHVKKLKEVNGYKQHNLMIKGKPRSGNNPFIYINNPVESKIPNAYLTLEEFKEALTKRVEKQRHRTTKAKQVVYLNADKLTRTIEKVTPTTFGDSLQPLLSDAKHDIHKFISSLYGVPKKDVILRASDTKDTKKSKKKTLPTPEFAVYTPDKSASVSKALNDEIFTMSSPIEIALTTQEINVFESTGHLKSTTQEISSMSDAKNEELIHYRTAIESTDHITRTTKGIEPIEVTRTSLIDFPRSELKTNRQAIEPQSYFTANSKSKVYSDNVEDENPVSNISTKAYTTILSSQATVNAAKGISKMSPKRVATSTETVSVVRQTPKRKSTLNKSIIKNKSIKTKRSTLGRPLVFMGGP